MTFRNNLIDNHDKMGRQPLDRISTKTLEDCLVKCFENRRCKQCITYKYHSYNNLLCYRFEDTMKRGWGKGDAIGRWNEPWFKTCI